MSIMNVNNTVTASLAECYVEIGDKRYNFMQAINLEAKVEKIKTEVPILGKTGKGNRSAGWKGTGSATFHYNNSIFRKMLEEYKNSGEDMYFKIQVINNDRTAHDIGAQEVWLLDCNVNGGILTKFDADGEYLSEDMEFTFEDFTITGDGFKNLPGMEVQKG